MRKTVRSLFFLAVMLFMHSNACCSQDITVTGAWTATLASPVTAGTDFAASFSSPANATTVNVSVQGNKKWKIYVQLTDTSGWNSAFTLAVYMTGPSTVNPDTNPASLQINTSSILICDGKGDVSGITFQYTLTGVTLAIPPNTYTTNVTYTITGN
ncbi:MAG: hypothetical protein AB2L14_00075 [Candidatus Xenobiia bacterium LiM19]